MKSFLRNISHFVVRALYPFIKNKLTLNEWKEGVSAVVVARNESYTLPLSLESLIGFADQIICIDNGSDDDTLKKMHHFKNKFSDKVIIKIIEAPGKLLVDCRNIGLKESDFNWHLRWDADMIFIEREGKYNAKWLKELLSKQKYPTAIKLQRINLSGDFYHVSKLGKIIDDGETFLVRRSKNLIYTESEKFDVLVIPFYYRIKNLPKPIVFHLHQLKSLERIIFRNEYFNWRKESISDQKLDFEKFKTAWELKMFGTTNQQEIKYRFHKKYVLLNSGKFDLKKFGPYPEQIQKAIDNRNERFKFIYDNEKPIKRLDAEDKDFENYIPSDADLKWDVDEHLKNIINENDYRKLNIQK